MSAGRGMRAVVHPHAWTAGALVPGEWRHRLPEAAGAELVDFCRRHADLPLDEGGDLGAAEAQARTLDACREAAAGLARDLEGGRGFLVLDALPEAALSTATARVAVWALFTCLGRVVDQKLTGHRVYDVKDKRVALAHGVRRSITNLEQEFHTDGGWLGSPPEVVGLCCLRPAAEGGVNRLVSLVTVHNRLLEEEPAILARLYEPFWWDRQAEHPAGEPPASRQPIFYRARSRGGRLSARYYDDYVRQGQRLAGAALDAPGMAALDAMRAVVSRPVLATELTLARGELLVIDNRRIAHSRSAFRDRGAARRHYLRVWSRRTGRQELEA